MSAMPAFAVAHAGLPAGATTRDWAPLALACADTLVNSGVRASLGFVYATDAFAGELHSIVAFLRQTTGIQDWVAGVGAGVVGDDTEYFDRPAVATMACALPREAFRLIPDDAPQGPALRAARDWIAARGPALGLLHADPRQPSLDRRVADLAATLPAFLVGGLTSGRAAAAPSAPRPPASSVLIGAAVPVVTGLSQGCTPVGPARTVTAGRDNVVFEIDGRPALEVLKTDIGEVLARRLERVAGHIHVALPVRGSDTGDYLVRNLVGIDPRRGWLAIGDKLEPGTPLLFCRRDRAAAEQDLVRMLSGLKRRAGGAPKAGLYFTCLARGPNLFGPDSAELALIRRELGAFPLVGMFCDGEIANDRVYGYSGVLALFV